MHTALRYMIVERVGNDWAIPSQAAGGISPGPYLSRGAAERAIEADLEEGRDADREEGLSPEAIEAHANVNRERMKIVAVYWPVSKPSVQPGKKSA